MTNSRALDHCAAEIETIARRLAEIHITMIAARDAAPNPGTRARSRRLANNVQRAIMALERETS